MIKVLDCSLKVSKFEVQLPCYIHFLTNTLWKNMNSLIPPSYGLDNITAVVLQGWFRYEITHEIKDTKPDCIMFHQK